MAKLTINREVAGANSGAKFLSKMKPVTEINTNSELSARFKIEPKVLDSIIKSITNSGYDTSEPIIIWKEENVVVDGHTRLEAAKQAGIEEVPVVEKSFKNIEEALAYTVHRQYDRRNLSQAEIYELAINVDKIEEKDGRGRATERLAEKIGVSSSTIEHARTVEKKAPDEIKEKIKNNEITINQAYQKVRVKQSKPKGYSINPTDNCNNYSDSSNNNYLNNNEKDISTPVIIEDISLSSLDSEEKPSVCLFTKIKNYDIKELAKYLANLQKEEKIHSETEWEEILSRGNK